MRRALGLVVLLAASCSSSTAKLGPFRVSTAHGPKAHVAAVASTGDTVIALASTDAQHPGDVLVRSANGGRSWQSGASPLAHVAVPASQRVELRVVTTGPWALLLRTIDVTGVSHQDAAISTDGGATWRPLVLPAGASRTAIAEDALPVGGSLVVVGATRPATGPGTDAWNHEVEDVAAWNVPARGVATLTDTGAAEPASQRLWRVVAAPGRLIAAGTDTGPSFDRRRNVTAAWTSTDSGHRWVRMPTPPVAEILRPAFIHLNGDLAITGDGGIAVFDQAAASWVPRQLGREGGRTIGSLTVDGHQVTTGVIDVACDCSWATVSIDGSSTRLPFGACDDHSVRGENGIGEPTRLGTLLVAPAWCSHRGTIAGAVAWSADRGRSWHTRRLGGSTTDQMAAGARTTDALVFVLDGADGRLLMERVRA